MSRERTHNAHVLNRCHTYSNTALFDDIKKCVRTFLGIRNDSRQDVSKQYSDAVVEDNAKKGLFWRNSGLRVASMGKAPGKQAGCSVIDRPITDASRAILGF